MTLLSNSFLAVPSTANAITVDDSIRSDNDPQSTTSNSNVDGPTPSQVLAMTIKKKRRILRYKDRDMRVELLLTSTIRRLCQEIGDHLRARRMANMKRKSMAISAGFDDENKNDSTTPTVRQHANKRNRVLIKEEGASETVKMQEVGPVEVSTLVQEPTSLASVGTLAANEPTSLASVGTLAANEPNVEEERSSAVAFGRLRRKRKTENQENNTQKRVSSSSTSEEEFNEKDPFGLDEFFRAMRSCRVGANR